MEPITKRQPYLAYATSTPASSDTTFLVSPRPVDTPAVAGKFKRNLWNFRRVALRVPSQALVRENCAQRLKKLFFFFPSGADTKKEQNITVASADTGKHS